MNQDAEDLVTGMFRCRHDDTEAAPAALSSPCDQEPFPAWPIWHVADVEQVQLGLVEIGANLGTLDLAIFHPPRRRNEEPAGNRPATRSP
ncbi:MAG: hypothetical protein ACR2M5_05590 [Nakamurella sp.]